MSKQVQVLLKKLNSKYSIPPTNLSVPISFSWSELNQTLLALLSESDSALQSVKPEFDFLINGQLLVTNLQELITANAISTEQLIIIKYTDRSPPPSQPEVIPHSDWVSALSLADRHVLTGSYDGCARVWDLSTFSLVSEVKCHAEPISSIVSLNSKLVVTGSHDESVCFWEGLLPNQSPTCLFRGFHSQPVTCLAANDTHLCSGSWDRTLKLWQASSLLDERDANTPNLQTGKFQPQTISPVSTLDGHTDTVSACIWSRDSSRLVSCSWDQTILFWDAATCQSVRCLSGSRALLSVSESERSGLVATGGSDNVVRVWNTGGEEAAVIRLVLRGHSGWVSCVAWSRVSEFLLISGSYDGSMKLWDIRSPTSPLYTVGAHKKKLLCMDWKDGGVVASGGEDCRLIVSHL